MAETADLTIVGASDRTQWASEYWWSFNQSQVYFCFRHKIKNEKKRQTKKPKLCKDGAEKASDLDTKQENTVYLRSLPLVAASWIALPFLYNAL